MQKNEYFERTKEFLSSSRVLKLLYLVTFTVLITCIIASQNFFFQSIIENGISKRDIIAQKTLTVEDVKRTEQHKREVAQKVEPILVPAEDDFIKSTLKHFKIQLFKSERKTVQKKKKLKN